MEGKPFIDWQWIFTHLDDIVWRLWQHIQLTVIPVSTPSASGATTTATPVGKTLIARL